MQTGGLDKSTLTNIFDAKLPELQKLELHLGTDEYGASCKVEDLQPLLSGRLFPKLRHLGLCNWELVDELCGVLPAAPVLDRIETLDLSYGQLSEASMAPLLEILGRGKLKQLFCRHHYLSAESISALEQRAQKFGVEIDLADPQDQSDDWRTVVFAE